MPFLLRMTYSIVKHYRRLEHSRFIVMLMDFILLSLAVYVGFALRLSLLIPKRYIPEMLNVMAVYSSVMVLTFYICKIYKVSWSKSSVEEFSRLIKSYWSAAVLFIFLAYFKTMPICAKGSPNLFTASASSLVSCWVRLV